MYADGRSPGWIAHQPNEAGVPSPDSAYRRKVRRTGGWTGNTVYSYLAKGAGMLTNLLYIGH